MTAPEQFALPLGVDRRWEDTYQATLRRYRALLAEVASLFRRAQIIPHLEPGPNGTEVVLRGARGAFLASARRPVKPIPSPLCPTHWSWWERAVMSAVKEWRCRGCARRFPLGRAGWCKGCRIDLGLEFRSVHVQLGLEFDRRLQETPALLGWAGSAA